MHDQSDKITGFDFIRAFAIFFVFLSHIIHGQADNARILLIAGSISPGLTMSVLGFISGYLLTSKHKDFDGVFYVKRFSRIYSSLITCLSVITILHLFLSYDVINQHSIIHFMGLSFFMNLFEVANKSSIGDGLWFVTIINILYLLLPLISKLYNHKYKYVHLVIVVLFSLFLNQVMYTTASAWNVIISFNIGCYVGLNSNIDFFTKKSFKFYLFSTSVLLILCGLATSKMISYEFRSLLIPLYPFFAVPLLFKIGNNLKGWLKSSVVAFSFMSFEFYILHFYFINENLLHLFPSIKSVYYHILISAIIILPVAYLNSKIAKYFSNVVSKYFLAL